MVSAVIPAYDEAQTIADVVRVIARHPLIDEVIVIDDGSTDQTAQAAMAAGAFVARFPFNQGKAQAMQRGIELAKHDYIFFSDADLVGLTHDMMTTLLAPLLSGDYELVIGVRDRPMYRLNRLLRFIPLLGGERALTKRVWNLIPDRDRKKFQIEIAMNYHAKMHGAKTCVQRLCGLRQVVKEKKRGFCRGFCQRLGMFKDLIAVSIRLYCFESLRLWMKRSARESRSRLDI